jgi:lipopolysaccharide/colanic/teichoic acid biosynthesis glycosyltransferase
MYAKFFKRVIDFTLSLMALIVLSPVLLVLAIIGAIAMKGNPFFTQLRPGKIDKKTGEERIFKLVKFRTMSNAKDKDGNLLPDDVRLNKYGRFLRSTSLDELPELWNILKGDMSIVGPRPQLVRDMVFMTSEERKRHTVRQGLTGLAQVNGRNNMSWEKKFEYDLQYIENITFWGDIKILFKTVFKVFARDGISTDGMATAEDLGDYLLNKGVLENDEYNAKQEKARELIGRAL